jgi:hypothetical protein
MIQPQRVAPEHRPPHAAPELRRIDRVRHATKRRARRTRRRMQRPVFAVVALAFAVLVPLLAYVTLTANITSLNFALARASHDRAQLLEESQRLDDRIARLQSPERLAALATALKLHDPHVYAEVRVPEPKAQPKPTGLAFFGTWFAAETK